MYIQVEPFFRTTKQLLDLYEKVQHMSSLSVLSHYIYIVKRNADHHPCFLLLSSQSRSDGTINQDNDNGG